MFGSDRLISRLRGADRWRFMLCVAMFLAIELVALLHVFGISWRFAGMGISTLALASGFNIENWLYIIINAPKEDEETNPSPYLSLAYIIPPVAAFGSDETKWLIAVSIAACALLLSRIVWILMQPVRVEVGPQG